MQTQETLTIDFQKRLFLLIRSKLDSKTNLAKVVSELLHVGIDAAYKKISAARILDLIELHILLDYFGLNYQDLDGSSNNSMLYMHQFIPSAQTTCLESYLGYQLKLMEELKPTLQSNLILSLPELNFLHLASSPELTSFYAFLLQKHVLNLPEFKYLKFDLDQTEPRVLQLAKCLQEAYFTLPSTEIWHANAHGFLPKQLRYYKDAQLLKQPQAYEILLDQYKQLLQHLEFEVFEGQKYDRQTGIKGAAFALYHHELLGGEQAMYAPLAQGEKVWIQTHGLQMLCTSNTQFTAPYYQNLLDLQAKGTCLSKQNEKVISPFFYGVIQEMQRAY